MEIFVKDGKLVYCDHCFPDSLHIVLDWKQTGVMKDPDPEAMRKWSLEKFYELLTEHPY